MPVFPVCRVSAMRAAAIDPTVLLVRLKGTTALSADGRSRQASRPVEPAGCAQMKMGSEKGTGTFSKRPEKEPVPFSG